MGIERKKSLTKTQTEIKLEEKLRGVILTNRVKNWKENILRTEKRVEEMNSSVKENVDILVCFFLDRIFLCRSGCPTTL